MSRYRYALTGHPYSGVEVRLYAAEKQGADIYNDPSARRWVLYVLNKGQAYTHRKVLRAEVSIGEGPWIVIGEATETNDSAFRVDPFQWPEIDGVSFYGRVVVAGEDGGEEYLYSHIAPVLERDRWKDDFAFIESAEWLREFERKGEEN